MIALIESDKLHKSRGGTYIGCERVCGIRVLRVVLRADERQRPRRFARQCTFARKEMQSRGVKNVCFRDDFSARDSFLKCGFSKISLQPLMQKEAARISRLAAGKESDTVAVFTSRIMLAESQTIRSLAQDFRYVLLFAGASPATLVCDLAEHFGASLVETPSHEMLNRAGAAVFFESPGRFVKLPERCSAVFVSGIAPEKTAYSRYIESVSFSAPSVLEASLPSGYPRDELLSAAFASGAPGSEKICVSGIQLKNTYPRFVYSSENSHP